MSVEDKFKPNDEGVADPAKRQLVKRLFLGVATLYIATNPVTAEIARAFSVPEAKTNQPVNSSLLVPQQFNPDRELRRIKKLDGASLNQYLLESFEPAKDLNFYLPNNPYIRSEDGFLLRDNEPWTTRLWWPFFEETARAAEPEQPTLHAQWWPAHFYNLLGGLGDAWGQAIEKADFIKTHRTDRKRSAGYCTWVAVSQLLDRKPEAAPGEHLVDETNSDRIEQLKEGLLVIKNAGAVLVPIPVTPGALISAFVQGLPVLFNLPEDLGSGEWFRSGVGIREDGKKVRATNFGFPHRDFNISSIVGPAYIAFRADSPLTFAPGIRESTSFYRFDVDRNFIDQIVYPG